MLVNYSSIINLPKDMILDNEGNENNKLGYPYKLARYVKGKRPYIVYYIWNENENKLQRMRREVPKGVIPKNWVSEKIKKINELLVTGFRIKKEEILENSSIPDTNTIEKVFNWLLETRKKIVRDTTFSREKSHIKAFLAYYEKKKKLSSPIDSIQKTDIVLYLDSIPHKAITKNNTLSCLRSLFSFCIERGICNINPCKGIKKLKQEQTKTVVFAPEHLKLLKDAMVEESTELYIFAMCIFYTFIRPIELRRLYVNDVKLDDSKIYISGEKSKNKKSEYVMIPKPLANIFKEYDFLNRPGTNKLFETHKNKMNYSRTWYANKFREICRAKGLPEEYTLYCWKHTGVTEYFKNGANIKFIQMQCRHASLQETDKYLKSLALFENTDILNNAPEI